MQVIHRLAETELTGAYLQHLPQVRTVPAAALGELATRTLPELVTARPAGTPKVPVPGEGSVVPHCASTCPLGSCLTTLP